MPSTKTLPLPLTLTLLTLLHLISSEIIIHNYSHNNKGTSGNNSINGSNNTWIGVQNKINGTSNDVKGDTNRISGNNNYVQGNGNVVGQVDASEMARLQNQMQDKMAERFGNMFKRFNFHSEKSQQKKSAGDMAKISQQGQVMNNSVVAADISSLQIKKNITQQPSQIIITTPHPPINDEQQPAKDLNATSIIKQDQPIQQNITLIDLIDPKEPENKVIQSNNIEAILQSKIVSTLIFHSFGSCVPVLGLRDMFNRRDNVENYCRRWENCIKESKQIMPTFFFSSIYPTFPVQPQKD